jgi:excisionase family DNA binding protein
MRRPRVDAPPLDQTSADGRFDQSGDPDRPEHGSTRHGTTAKAPAASSWMTPRQAALYLRVGVDTIYEACAADDLKHVKLGYRTIRLRREWIDLWAEKHASPIERDGGA